MKNYIYIKNYIKTIIVVILSILFITIFMGASNKASKKDIQKVPILMYHSIYNKNLGEFVVSPSTFEQDIKFLKDSGYNSIKIEDIINFVENNKKLPSKVIAITFDDGNYNFITNALPILKKYNFIGIVSIVGHFTDREKDPYSRNDSYSSMNEKELKEIATCPNVEILNHTYNLHFGCGAKKPKFETNYNYFERVGKDLQDCNKIITRITGKNPLTFTCPYGFYSCQTIELIKNLGFKAMLTCNEGVNNLSYNNTEKLFELKRYNRPNGKDIESFLKFKKII